MPPDRWLALTVRVPPSASSPGREAPETAPHPRTGEDGRTLAPGSAGGDESSTPVPPVLHLRELLPELLLELGGRGVEEVEDAFTTYLQPPEDLEAFLQEARARLQEVAGTGAELRWAWQPQEDWETLWRAGLGPRRITRRLHVAPTWDIPEVGEGEILIVLDPGMAFGTAEHATTRGCLRLLDSRVREGDRIADIGSGSGILAIAAARLGAREVLAVEMDPLACEVAEENISANGVQDRVRILVGEVREGDSLPGGPYQGIVANIQRSVLLPLLSALRRNLATGGWLILSGIQAEERDVVRSAASRHGLVLEGEDGEGEWWSGAFAVTNPPPGVTP
jgi:ribosomal protein L11 methyltransferase